MTTQADEREERIVDIDVSEEMRGSFLEYAYSVIYSRALPDARDGLKPVQRRILYQMAQMRLLPDRGHVKSARVTGEVMGRLHPHGDGAIYDALVRMAQPFTLRLPMIDGHGNFGSIDDGPAAMRYTECRLAPPALAMTDSLDEDVVDYVPNYDGREEEPVVLPAAIPNLLVNGASGIAVGMATNMAPHNLREVVAAAKHLLEHPNARLDTLMRLLPGPDLPTGGEIIGLDGIREAYETGRGRFRMRASAGIEQVSARKQGIVITALPYNVGPEKVTRAIKDLVVAKKLKGISDLTDLTDAEHGLRLVVEVKSGFNPEAILAQLYAMTPLEEQFSINNVTLVNGTPQTLGLVELLRVFLDHRLEVVTRRSRFRRTKAADRLHLVEGLLIAILDIDEVIAIVRGSDNAAIAKERLITAFDLSDIQATHILDMPLRRLTKFSRLELEAEADELRVAIEALTRILEDDSELRRVVAAELSDVAERYGDERRTVLLAAQASPAVEPESVEVADEPCWVALSTTGRIARTGDARRPTINGTDRACALTALVPSSARAQVGVITSDGQLRRLNVVDLPVLPETEHLSVAGGTELTAFVSLEPDTAVVGLVPLADDSACVAALATASGQVKRVDVNGPASRDQWEIIGLAKGDRVVAARPCPGDDHELVFVTRQAQLLRFRAKAVRVQGRGAAGMAGIGLRDGDEVIAFAALSAQALPDSVVATVATQAGALPGTTPGTGKTTPLSAYPSKGRATGGVRCQRLRSGEDGLGLAWVGLAPVAATTSRGRPVPAPPLDEKRDGTGHPLAEPIGELGGVIW